MDNFNGIKILNRTIRVDHVGKYRGPKKDDEEYDSEEERQRKMKILPSHLVPKEWKKGGAFSFFSIDGPTLAAHLLTSTTTLRRSSIFRRIRPRRRRRSYQTQTGRTGPGRPNARILRQEIGEKGKETGKKGEEGEEGEEEGEEAQK